jgi:hypothetical protein
VNNGVFVTAGHPGANVSVVLPNPLGPARLATAGVTQLRREQVWPEGGQNRTGGAEREKLLRDLRRENEWNKWKK